MVLTFACCFMASQQRISADLAIVARDFWYDGTTKVVFESCWSPALYAKEKTSELS